MKLKNAPLKTIEKVVKAMHREYSTADAPRMLALVIAHYDVRKKKLPNGKSAYYLNAPGHQIGLGVL